MMNCKKNFCFAAALISTAVSQVMAQGVAKDFEYHGYMRSGIGVSRASTDQQCFSAVGASAKFRLGNECETYIEATFVKIHDLSNKNALAASGPSFATHLNLALVSEARHDWEPTTATASGTDASGNPKLEQELTLSLREAWVQARGVLGKTKPWVGKRFYRRQDIHILDYYIIANSGPGAGIENIDAGVGQLHLALTRNTDSNTKDGPAQTNADFRLSDITVGPGKLEALLIYGAAGERGHHTGEKLYEAISGQQLGLVYGLETGLGTNRVTWQYGQGLFGGDVASRSNTLGGFGGSSSIAKDDDKALDARKKSSTMRLVEELNSQFGSSISSSFVLLYQTTDFGGAKDAAGDDAAKKDELMLGARPVLALSKYSSVAFEYGLVSVKNAQLVGGEYKDSTLHKATIAPQLTAGDSFWARPQLRVFATYAKWDEDSKGNIASPVYAGETSGFSTGAQVEAWW
jgi:maltoporin